MSSAGRPFTEHIFEVSESEAGSKTFDFTVENDGAIIYIQRLSGAATITGSIYSELPPAMTRIELESFTITDDTPANYGHIFARSGRITVSWDAAVSFKILVKQASGGAVSQFNPSIIVIDQYDGWSVTDISVGTVTPVQVTNTSTEKSVGIRHWGDSDNTEILYARHTNTDVVSSGWPLAVREGLSLDIGPGVSIWLLADGGTVDVRVIKLENSST